MTKEEIFEAKELISKAVEISKMSKSKAKKRKNRRKDEDDEEEEYESGFAMSL